MSSVLVEYPEGLPAPTTGEVRPTERRTVSSVGQMRNTRAIQRDRHGTRTVAFTFTPEQAAIFREWWVEWLQLGGGWFAANWPLPWSRGPNVFRFTDPPQWQLIGGRLDGQGYWQVRATCEIRGRGMLPTAEVMYLTSTPYPIVSIDSIFVESGAIFRTGMPVAMDRVNMASDVLFSERDTHKKYNFADGIEINNMVSIYARTPIQNIKPNPDKLSIESSVSISARVSLIRHTIKTESINITSGVSINVT